ncbi:TonB-dependent receptor [Algibacter lectus]|uniref:TonB-dependent receptor n=1 Tax=Algibacter lectus TaxID=221126 RepID=A0A090WSJ7_9FLAO|nr:TonB-dependent receptor [Algibacter lectus]
MLAQEPNRVRNEANILDENTVQYAHVGDFQQRKSSQKIEDTEYNAYINDAISFGTLDEDDNHPFN